MTQRRISVRQKREFEARPEGREWFAVGQQMARAAILGRLAQQQSSGDGLSPAAARRNQALAAGRETRTAVRHAARQRLAEESGAPDLSAYLRARYAAGASLEQLARETAMGRESLRAAMQAARICLRSRGVNTPAGKSARAAIAELEAAAHIGTDDLRGWLQARRDEGWTLQRLAGAVNHSSPWVRVRLGGESVRPVRQLAR